MILDEDHENEVRVMLSGGWMEITVGGCGTIEYGSMFEEFAIKKLRALRNCLARVITEREALAKPTPLAATLPRIATAVSETERG